MIYATSDIHGYPLDSFLRMLDSAGFGDTDTLYVLGDVIDRNGDGGIAMLRWIMNTPNVRFLLGNHEKMLYPAPSCMTELTMALKPSSWIRTVFTR
jgi:serine/threonine protein phosphatase 1